MLQIAEDDIQSTFKKYELEKIQLYNRLLFTLVKAFFKKRESRVCSNGRYA